MCTFLPRILSDLEKEKKEFLSEIVVLLYNSSQVILKLISLELQDTDDFSRNSWREAGSYIIQRFFPATAEFDK